MYLIGAVLDVDVKVLLEVQCENVREVVKYEVFLQPRLQIAQQSES